jgi:hypothetical protein
VDENLYRRAEVVLRLRRRQRQQYFPGAATAWWLRRGNSASTACPARNLTAKGESGYGVSRSVFQGEGGTVSVPPCPPSGPPPPVCGATPPPAVGAVGPSPCTPPGAAGRVGDGGFGIGAALTGPNPNGSVVMEMPAAIAAAQAAR